MRLLRHRSIAHRCATVLLLMGMCVAPPIARALHAQNNGTEATPDAFVLGPGDVIKVTIWREKELSGSFQVDETGMLTLPMLGRLRGAGIPWHELRDSLLVRYTAQLRTTSIILQPQRRVYVFGEVAKPGDLRRIRIVRGGTTLRANVPVESLFVGTALKSEDQIYVGKRSWFDRNSTFIAGAALSLTSIIVSLIRR
jgi:hypothetical protein